MSAMDSYLARMQVNGEVQRAHVQRRTTEYLQRHLPDSLSYKNAVIDGVERSVMILSSEDKNIKKINALPGEEIPHGGLVDWEENKWLITELDSDNTLYRKGSMKQCNYVLKWINDNDEIVERWCIVEDGTKYLIGETNEDVMATGSARISVMLARDSETVKLCRGDRFIIDDYDTPEPLCYEITKPNRFFNVYNGDGVLRFIMTETNRTDNDNLELHIADYYNRTKPEIPEEKPDGRMSWL